MICKSCSTENEVDAVFCMNCGKRVDGKVPCPVCGKLNKRESNFCTACGANISGKTVCNSCGNVFHGAFCPQCGTKNGVASITPPAVSPDYAPAYAPAVKPAREGTGSWRKVLELVGGALALAAVFFALLFTFLIGVVPTMGETVSIYDYFGKEYDNIASRLDGIYYDENYAFANYITAAFGTLIGAATIIVVVVFAALTIARYVRKVTGKSQKDYGKCAATAVFAFLTGATAFLALRAASTNYINDDYVLGEAARNSSVAFSPATLAGIILSVLFLVAFIGMRIAINAKQIFQSKQLVTLCLSAGGALLFGLLIYFAGSVIVNISNNYGEWGSSYGSINQSILSLNTFYGITGQGEIGVMGEDFIPVIYLAFAGQTMQLVLLVLLAAGVITFLSNLMTEKGESNLTYAITAEVFAVIHLVLSVVTSQQYIDAQIVEGISELPSLSYAFPIVTLVFATLTLALTIVHRVFYVKQKKNAQMQPEPVYDQPEA